MNNSFLHLTECTAAARILREQADLLLTNKSETLPVRDSLHRILHEPVYARVSHPNFNAAAMDGIALRAESSYGAHERQARRLTRGVDYWPVDTGDCLPPECNAVMMTEDVIEINADTVEINTAVFPWQNVRVVGEDIIIGDMIAPTNHYIQAVDIGAILCAGVAAVTVRKKLRVGIVPTGNELHSAENAEYLLPGEIIDSNSGMLAAMVTEAGAIPKIYPITPDSKSLLRAAFLRAAAENDIVVIIAGSSAGTEDYTRPLIAELGTVFLHGIAIKPGKPAIFGKINEKLTIGLPGYPVAAFTIAREYLLPLLRTHAGLAPIDAAGQATCVEAVLSRRLISSIKHQEFVQLKLGRIQDRLVATPLNRGSGVTMSLVKADGFLSVPRASEGFEAGSAVSVQLLRPREFIDNALICTGSHDIIIDKINNLLAQSGAGWTLSSAHVGSLGGIMALKRNETHIAPIHLLDEATGEYNISYIEKYLPDTPSMLIRSIRRQQGLYFRRGEHIQSRTLAAIANQGLPFANRQKGSGTRVLLDYLLKTAGISASSINCYDQELLTHTAVALSVLSGNHAAGMGIESVARLLGLDFVQIGTERYDLLVPQEHFYDTRIQELLKILQTATFKNEIEALGGYIIDRLELIALNAR